MHYVYNLWFSLLSFLLYDHCCIGFQFQPSTNYSTIHNLTALLQIATPPPIYHYHCTSLPMLNTSTTNNHHHQCHNPQQTLPHNINHYQHRHYCLPSHHCQLLQPPVIIIITTTYHHLLHPNLRHTSVHQQPPQASCIKFNHLLHQHSIKISKLPQTPSSCNQQPVAHQTLPTDHRLLT